MRFLARDVGGLKKLSERKRIWGLVPNQSGAQGKGAEIPLGPEGDREE